MRWIRTLRQSLVWRTIVFANVASITLVLAMLYVPVRFAEHRFEALGDLTLWDQIDALRPLMRAVGDDLRIDLPAALASSYAMPAGAMRFAVVSTDGKLRAASSGIAAPLVDPRLVTSTASPYFAYDDPETGRVGRGVQVRLRDFPGIVLQVGQGPDHADVIVDSLMVELAEHFALALLGGLVVHIVVTSLTIRSTLRPLARFASDVADTGSAALSRLPIAEAPVELRPVAQRMNDLIDGLERSLERQRRFTADAAHQLRTPLARLQARIDATADARTAERLRDPLEQLRALVASLLDSSRAEALAHRTNERVDLVTIARSVGAALSPTAIARGVEIAMNAAETSPARGDALWIAQALENVVANAIRHAPTGSLVAIDVPGDGTVAVRDRGPGIPAEDRDRIFERFWRGKGETGPGAGLGLSIAAAVMQAHGGRIDVEAPDGGGTRFRLVFPAS